MKISPSQHKCRRRSKRQGNKGGLPAAVNNCIKRTNADVSSVGRHIWSFCARVGPFGVRRSGSNLLLPLLFIKGSRLRGGSTSTGCSPLSLSRPPPPTLSFFLSRWLALPSSRHLGRAMLRPDVFSHFQGKPPPQKKDNVGRCWISDKDANR